MITFRRWLEHYARKPGRWPRGEEPPSVRVKRWLLSREGGDWTDPTKERYLRELVAASRQVDDPGAVAKVLWGSYMAVCRRLVAS